MYSSPTNAPEYDFETFYQTKLYPYLDDLKVQSKSAAKWSITGTSFLAAAVIFFIIGQNLAGITGCVVVIISIYYYTRQKEDYEDNYKRTVINEIINYLNPGTEYKPSKMISSSDYRKSGLFRYKFDYYDGNDLVKGRYKNVAFYCSELQTQYDGGVSGNTQVTIFKGLFFAAPVYNNLTNNTYVWPKNDVQLAASVMDENYRLMPLVNVHPLKTDNPVFENTFRAFTNDTGEAKMILDNEMTERIVKFRDQIKRDIRLSVVNGIFYMAISIDEDLFEPSASNPGDKQKIKDYFFSVLLILSIINQLRLSRFV